MRLAITIMTEEKTVHVTVTDAEKIKDVKGLERGSALFFEDLHGFVEDVEKTTPDAGLIAITPENAIEILGAEPVEEPVAAPVANLPVQEKPSECQGSFCIAGESLASCDHLIG